MANPLWPTGLPSPYAAGAPAYQPYDNFIRSKTDAGPGKLRCRFTGNNDKLTFTLVLIPAQRTTFWNWYNNTIKGALPFDWVDLRTNATQTYRFASKPGESWVAGDSGAGWWELSIELDTVY